MICNSYFKFYILPLALSLKILLWKFSNLWVTARFVSAIIKKKMYVKIIAATSEFTIRKYFAGFNENRLRT